jgi:hypothetical protein
MQHPHLLPLWFSKKLLLPLVGAMALIAAVQGQPVMTESELGNAIRALDPSSEDATITLGASISLTEALPDIDKAGGTLTIAGGNYTLSRNSEATTDFRVLTITRGTVVIEYLTLSGGQTPGIGVQLETSGGGILNEGTLTMTHCTVSDNSADYGGGINNDGTLTLTDCTVSGNSADLGGGIYNSSEGTLTLTDCTVSGNSADEGAGGGIRNNGTLTLTDCTVSDNSAGFEGGMSNEGTLTLTDCTVSGNSAGVASGGIYNSSEGTLMLTNCTVSDNSADEGGGGGIGNGGTLTLTDCTVSGNSAAIMGGIFNLGTLTLTNCTVSGNSAIQETGGIYNSSEGTLMLTNCTVSGNSADVSGGFFNLGTLTLTHCTVSGNTASNAAGGIVNVGTLTLIRNIIAGNSAPFAAEIYDGATINAAANNLFGHSGLTDAAAFEGFALGASDVNGTSDGINTPLASILDPILADNGGPTLTHALVEGSPAIDIASEGPETDQRGYERPHGAGFDAGAVEFGSAPAPEEEDEDPPAPEENPTPTAVFEEYWHTVTSNTITIRNWNLDPNGILGDSPVHSLASGALPRGLRYEGASLVGNFRDLGVFAFTIVSRSGIHEVRNHFQVRVIPPALTPLISGIWVNDLFHSMIIMEERGHGVAAVTELFSVEAKVGAPLSMVFDWDYIKDDSSFKIIRGDLPTGLVLNKAIVNGIPTASITGTPTQTGEFIFVVSILDWRGRGYQWIRLVIE